MRRRIAGNSSNSRIAGPEDEKISDNRPSSVIPGILEILRIFILD